jgi:hypothetical protein
MRIHHWSKEIGHTEAEKINSRTKERRKKQLFAPFLDTLYRLANETHFPLLQIRPAVKKIVNCSVQAKEHRVDCEITPKGVEREYFCFESYYYLNYVHSNLVISQPPGFTLSNFHFISVDGNRYRYGT